MHHSWTSSLGTSRLPDSHNRGGLDASPSPRNSAQGSTRRVDCPVGLVCTLVRERTSDGHFGPSMMNPIPLLIRMSSGLVPNSSWPPGMGSTGTNDTQLPRRCSLLLRGSTRGHGTSARATGPGTPSSSTSGAVADQDDLGVCGRHAGIYVTLSGCRAPDVDDGVGTAAFWSSA